MAATSPPAQAAPKKSMKRLIVAVVAAMVALAAAGGAAAWYITRGKEDKAQATKGEAKGERTAAEKAAKANDRRPAVFVPMEPYTVNLQGPSREQYLQVGLVLEMADGSASEAVKQQMPVIRSQVLLLLAAKTAEELARPDGKDKLAAEVLEKVRRPLPSAAPLAGVEAVHYSAFIIQ
jgi:flagellar FliL protein